MSGHRDGGGHWHPQVWVWPVVKILDTLSISVTSKSDWKVVAMLVRAVLLTGMEKEEEELRRRVGPIVGKRALFM